MDVRSRLMSLSMEDGRISVRAIKRYFVSLSCARSFVRLFVYLFNTCEEKARVRFAGSARSERAPKILALPAINGTRINTRPVNGRCETNFSLRAASMEGSARHRPLRQNRSAARSRLFSIPRWAGRWAHAGGKPAGGGTREAGPRLELRTPPSSASYKGAAPTRDIACWGKHARSTHTYRYTQTQTHTVHAHAAASHGPATGARS